jgi:hypothetical protein
VHLHFLAKSVPVDAKNAARVDLVSTCAAQDLSQQGFLNFA